MALRERNRMKIIKEGEAIEPYLIFSPSMPLVDILEAWWNDSGGGVRSTGWVENKKLLIKVSRQMSKRITSQRPTQSSVC